MISRQIVVAGVGMVPFTKPGQGASYDVMGETATRAALADAGIAYGLIEQACCGYVYADSCAGQAALYRVDINGLPIVNVNNNCASGSAAFALAVQAVESGNADCALALGFEEMAPGAIDLMFADKVSPLQRHQQAIAGITGAAVDADDAPPALAMFRAQVDALLGNGVSEQTLAAIAVKSRHHAAANDNAMLRTPLTIAQVLAAPPLYGSLRKAYACPPSCGAAAVIVCTEQFARVHGVRSDVRLIGRGWRSDQRAYLNSGEVLDVMFQALSRDVAQAAYDDAGLGPEDIDVIELHDCFVSNELATYVALGLCTTEQLNGFVASADNTFGGGWVVNPSGGLLAKGHPLGATGLAQLTELTWQLRGDAGSRQVPGARTALQHNGGLGSAGYVHILQRV